MVWNSSQIFRVLYSVQHLGWNTQTGIQYLERGHSSKEIQQSNAKSRKNSGPGADALEAIRHHGHQLMLMPVRATKSSQLLLHASRVLNMNCPFSKYKSDSIKCGISLETRLTKGMYHVYVYIYMYPKCCLHGSQCVSYASCLVSTWCACAGVYCKHCRLCRCRSLFCVCARAWK